LKAFDYEVQPNTSVRAVEVGRRPDSDEFWNWRIAKLGTNAEGTIDDFDFALRYTLWIDTTNTPDDLSDDESVISCVFYGIVGS
jgi:hypothetical protein